ncbi:methyl-accepting chemotaxis protein [Paenibacillus xylaniclasticus]|uniref:methyl-accepting chemotaxis protein n=1 Tax=Paenibacillus xylaniclasticus TaxID=588083 RepID=UPI000FD8BD65|nr:MULTISPECIES: methyl-accepting chemotaxis protein [Paenibacillus]GFN31405.1 methyl-accepting chemotaxis protein [Paenibacillus curdlanolyticus]
MAQDTKQYKRKAKINFNTINNKLILSIVGITLISLALVSSVVSYKVSEQTEEDFSRSVDVQLKNIDASIEAFFAEVESNSLMLTNLSLLKETDKRITTYVDKKGIDGKVAMKPLEGDPFEAEVYKTFKSYVESHPNILASSLGVEENGGFVQYPENPRDEGYDARQRSWYELATANPDKVNFSDAYTTSGGQLVIYAARAILDDNKQLRGVLSIDIDLTSLTDVMKTNKIGETGYIVLADRLGNIIAHPKDDSLLFSNISALGIKEFEDVEKLPKVPFKTTLNGQNYISSVNPSSNQELGLNYIVIVEESEFTKSASEIEKFILFTTVIVIIVSIIIAYFISSRISKPIKFVSSHLKQLGNGDFTPVIPEKYLRHKGEVGDIMRDTSNMQTNLTKLIASISDASKVVSVSSNELMETSEQSVIAADEVSRAIAEISKSAGEQAVDTEQGAMHMNELGNLITKDRYYIANLNQSANEVDAIKLEVIDILKDLVEKTESSYAEAKEVSDVIINTNESASKIEMASQMIKGIAEQTNLLALNASIEAARAGEYGKGFAVVAYEIRKLAEQSNKFTQEISEIIHDLTGKTEFAVEKIHEVGRIVQLQTESVNNTNSRVDRIAEAIDKMKQAITHINNSSNEMESKKNEIIQIIDSLAASTEENAAGTEEASASVEEQTASMEEISTASKRLAKLAHDMQESIDQFKYLKE